MNATATALIEKQHARSLAPAADGSTRHFPQKKSAWKLLGEVLDHGGPGYLQFAITNICNAQCGFFGFSGDRFDSKQSRSGTFHEAKDVIDIAPKKHIGYLLCV